MAEKLIQIVARNRTRVLAEITSMFAHRLVDLVSLSVTRGTPDAMMTMHLVIDSPDEHATELLVKRLNRIVEVVKVGLAADTGIHQRTGVLVRVAAGGADRAAVVDLAGVMTAEIVEVAPTTITLAYQSTPANVDLMLTMLSPFKIVEVVVVGTAGIGRSPAAGSVRRCRGEAVA